MSTTVEGRAARLPEGWRQFRDKPLGLAPHGLRQTEVEMSAHNDYAAFLFERGYPGLAGLVLLLGGGVARAVYSGLQGDAAHRRLMGALLGALLVTVIIEWVHEFIREREVWLVMASIVLFARFELGQRQSRQRDIQATRWPTASAKPE
jgi:O-antigen ligase